MKSKKIAVYCGSAPGNDPIFREAAEEMASYFAKNDITLVNGGGSIGLMGIMADKILSLGGKCIGVIPIALKEKELAHYEMTELVTTVGMHGRKRFIMDVCDAFIALPGGFGTLDELFECLTWSQLNFHQGNVGILNVNGFFDPILDMIQKMNDMGFVNDQSKTLLIHDQEVNALMQKLAHKSIPERNKFSTN